MPEVRRELTLDAHPDDVWEALSTEDGLASWLAEGVDGAIAEGGRATFRYAGGEEREALIEEVSEGSHVTWSWSRDGREESRVVVALRPDGDGSRIVVTETAPAWHATASAARDTVGRFFLSPAALLPEWATALRRLAALPLGRVALCA